MFTGQACEYLFEVLVVHYGDVLAILEYLGHDEILFEAINIMKLKIVS